ncbi:MAG: dipeptide/oligopeptide/nickel ABC transporter permease/ATP-binding protein [Acidimicrobiales bacterium]|nr:dipeptide/oligopeptide/nickel ABC transporter permease/ATP-binding protein [Acidimicrobiales bacterium]RZV47005.1 MAG: dipeptide/oligopeptide/nickel ABC transporter permease/ATP-binding protein [Acidimicrobiales bacterium]
MTGNSNEPLEDADLPAGTDELLEDVGHIPTPSGLSANKTDSPRRRFWRRMFKNPLGVFSMLWFLILLVAWVWPELLATHDPFKQDLTFTRLYEGPSSDHWLGTDERGRDFYSRVIHGAGFAFRSILIAMTIAVGVGVPLGMFSGWRGGRLDRAIMWVNDVFFSLPIILLAMAVIIILSPSLDNAMIGVGIAMSTRFTRLTRAVTLQEKEELYVDAARISGLSTPTVLARYIAPNLLSSLIVQAAIISGAIILIGATLSFLGIGASLDDPDWGVMLNRGRNIFRTEGIWQIVPPGAALILTVLAFNLLGDAIRDAIGRDASNNALTISKRVDIAPSDRPHRPGALLSVRTIDVEFPSPGKEPVQILNGVSLGVLPGKTLGIVGESGSGKSMTVLSALGLTPAPGRLTRGSVQFDERDVTSLSESEWQEIRGKDIGVIFQEPIAVLNPAIKVGKQLMEPLLLHTELSKAEARQRAVELLAEVKVPDPERRMDQYPHEFSGGMAQRVGIAMALACSPKLLIADEPTTALDVTVQGQILDLLMDLQKERGTSIILITHDLGVIAEVADRVIVMYAGQVVEGGLADDIFGRPRHPYTKALLDTMPQNHHGGEGDDLAVIPGVVPAPTDWPVGCRFAPRCQYATDRCREEMPVLEVLSDGVIVRCHHHEELSGEAYAGRGEVSL